MNRALHAALIVTMTVAAVLLIRLPGAYADVTPSFDVDIVVNKDYSFNYTETITEYFDSPQHGIYRNIPMDNEYRVRDFSVDGFDYKVSKSDGYHVIRVGSADYTVSGEVVYPIKYTIYGIEDTDSEHDHMYLDVIPTGWQSDIASAHVVVHCPEDMPLDRYNFFVGRYGMGTHEMESELGKWTIDEAAHTITFEGHDLKRATGATLDVELPEDYWQGELSYRFFRYIALVAACAGLLAILIMRLTVGRNPRVVKPVEFYAPEGMTPLDVGYIIDGHVDDADIVSTFFYLADKGYIDIKEKSIKFFQFKRLAVPTEENKSIQRFYKGIFGVHAFDDIETTDAKYNTSQSNRIGSRMSTAYEQIPGLLKKEFDDAGRTLYTAASKRANLLSKWIVFIVMMIVGICNTIYVNDFEQAGAAPVIACLIFSVPTVLLILWLERTYDYLHTRRGTGTFWRVVLWALIYLLLMSGYLTVFATFDREGGFDISDTTVFLAMLLLLAAAPFMIIGMKSRSREGADLYGRVLGFKNFIKTAELPKLNELVEENPNYFYNVLPYAYVFGLTDKWAKKFENIAIPEPEWYHPYVVGDRARIYNPTHMTSAMNNVSHNITASMSRADAGSSRRSSGGGISSGGGFSSGGGGGFSGGGFSGGGFGGGGGGKW